VNRQPPKMQLPREVHGLVLVCKHCRWRPRIADDMTAVERHFADEPAPHDPDDLQLEMVAWCFRCEREMPLESSLALRDGRTRHTFGCILCHRTKTVVQGPQ
jgi:hypothetical protein